MKKIFLLPLFSLLFAKAIAQNNVPPVYEINADTAYIKIPDSCWQMIEDADGKWTINEVSQSPLAEKFHSNTGVNSSINTYWARYRIKNDMAHEAKISFSNRWASYFEVFIKQADSTWDHKKTGYLLPWSERDGSKEFNAIPFSINPGQELLVYQRIKFELKLYPPKYINVYFGPTEKIVRDGTINYYKAKYFGGLRQAITFGICILAAIFCLFFFLTTNERVYFHASMMDISIALFAFMDPLRDIFFREYPGIRDYGYAVVIAFFLYFMTSTFRYALDTKHLFPRLNNLLITLSVLPFLSLLVLFTFPTPPFSTIVALPVLSSSIFLSIFIICLAVMRKKNRTARLLIIGVLLYTVYEITDLATLLLGVTRPVWLEKYGLDVELLCHFFLIVITTWILFDRYRQLQVKLSQEAFEKAQLAKQKEIERRQLIEQQKQELEKQITERTAELKHSLQELKSTQSQLIQQEKMASLGELTAGIAHEIQNPLNFVNNFSEVNNELIEELQGERSKVRSERNEELESEILNDIRANEEKINHHGKRADAIVKGMLQHSKASTGKKEPTDVNALCDEYLRLSYHGMRAKDKNFNAELKTDFDESITKMNVVPQDIGRVLLNLFNNAFYAVNEKLTAHRSPLTDGYKPLVSVQTKKVNDKIEITVKDNGNGIPSLIKDKIFQPFFTTKPTGQGTGLGLSLSYDTVKAHGGEIKVETKEGEGSEFIIQLPVN